jgi:hypothetical protein
MRFSRHADVNPPNRSGPGDGLPAGSRLTRLGMLVLTNRGETAFLLGALFAAFRANMAVGFGPLAVSQAN